jgi:hypothetical protein
VTKTLLFKFLGDLVLLVHGTGPPSDADWSDYVAALELHKDSLRCVLVVSDGPGPNAAQRSRINALVDRNRRAVPTAVVTHSTVARGIVTVLHWFNPGIRAFAPDHLAGALDYLGVAPTQHEPITREVAGLRMALAVDPAAASRAMGLADTIAKLEEMVTERLPAIRKHYSSIPPKLPD